jgi:hypothetical protein
MASPGEHLAAQKSVPANDWPKLSLPHKVHSGTKLPVAASVPKATPSRTLPWSTPKPAPGPAPTSCSSSQRLPAASQHTPPVSAAGPFTAPPRAQIPPSSTAPPRASVASAATASQTNLPKPVTNPALPRSLSHCRPSGSPFVSTSSPRPASTTSTDKATSSTPITSFGQGQHAQPLTHKFPSSSLNIKLRQKEQKWWKATALGPSSSSAAVANEDTKAGSGIGTGQRRAWEKFAQRYNLLHAVRLERASSTGVVGSRTKIDVSAWH